MWRARLFRARDWLLSRRLVGEDEHHFYYAEFIKKGSAERRFVEYKDQDITHCSDRMPIEWWSWLHNRRVDTPSDEEIALSEARQERLAERVAILEAEDEKQRLRQFAGSVPGRKASTVDEEVRAKRRNNVVMQLAKAAAPKGSGREVVVAKEAEDLTDSAGERDTYSKGDAKSAGEEFRPKSWQPPKKWRRGK